MSKNLNIAYMAGGAKYTLEPFNALLNSKHNLKIVCTKKNVSSGRGKKKENNFLLRQAKNNNITCITPNNFKEEEYINPLCITGPESISVSSKVPEIAPAITRFVLHTKEPVLESKAINSPVLLGNITKFESTTGEDAPFAIADTSEAS